jgi:hypothetical protein
VGSSTHLADQPLLLNLSPKLPQRLLELLRILDDNLQPRSHLSQLFPLIAQATTTGLGRSA